MTHRSSENVSAGREKSLRMRESFFPDINAFVQTPVLNVDDLVQGERHSGPALIEQPGSTVVIGPGDHYSLDAFDNIRISLGAKSGNNA
jgi:N-methylhydantoinase A